MRWIMIAMTLLGFGTSVGGAQEPLVEKYLHSGELARGEQVLEVALANAPADDQLRFGLAVLQLVRGVERLGQSLYQYGCKSENTNLPFLRVPVPHNPDPSPITYRDLRRVLDGFRSDLATVESTLAGIKTDDVRLPLRLSDIRLDLTGQGEARERFVEILTRLMGSDFHLPEDNTAFLVCFDRGDVAWLRAYCHLLMALIDASLAIDGESHFEVSANQQFALPKLNRSNKEQQQRLDQLGLPVKIVEPARLGHFRLHVVKVCELNRETWNFIRAEVDDDYEWLPNPKQAGVLRMPVTERMIESWLAAMGELESLFNGKRVIPAWVIQLVEGSTKKGLNVKAFFDDPPEEIDWSRVSRKGIRDKYLDEKLRDADITAFVSVFEVFSNPLAVGYAAWFN